MDTTWLTKKGRGYDWGRKKSCVAESRRGPKKKIIISTTKNYRKPRINCGRVMYSSNPAR